MSGLCEHYKSVNMFFSLFANVIYLPIHVSDVGINYSSTALFINRTISG